MNQIVLIGNLGKDAELKEFNSKKVAKFSVATKESYKDDSGQWQETTTWNTVSIWTPTEHICKAKKGELILFTGKVASKSYEKEGKKVYYTEISGKLKRLNPEKESKPAQENKVDDIGGDNLPFNT